MRERRPAVACARWERLAAWAEREGNSRKALEFKEKLVECVVYTAQERVRRGKLDEAEEILKYGREAAKRLVIEELEFHVSLIEREIARVRELRRARASAGK
ncbi:MAG: hypothetical protein LM577_01150 [Thermoproteaceae archaeon]|jgi:hypothetical protein|nr:hypothetical protein [Thermoproteaceae archaeon]